jgi:predicted PurR-regulated permease PerM
LLLATLRAVSRRMWGTLAGYVRGQAIIAAVDAVGIGLGLLIIGVPLALPLTVLTFLGGFVPILRAFTAGLLAVLVALVNGGLGQALLVLALVVVVQQTEGNVLEPLVLGCAVPLHPAVVLLAVPVAAVISAAGNELRLRHEGATEADNQA